MKTSAIPRHLPTFATRSRSLLLPIRRLPLLIRGMCRVGVRLAPRVAMVLVLVMSCKLAWIVLMPGLTDRVMVPAPGLADRVMVPATIRYRTVAFSYSDPPQPVGDCFGVSPMPSTTPLPTERGRIFPSPTSLWMVCNMHAQNFAGIVERLGLRTVEVQPLGNGRCLITDPRIPRDWLRDRPCHVCFRDWEAEDLLRRYPERFQPPAAP